MDFDIQSIKRKMLIKYPFFGSIVANVDYKENPEIKTAGTDGKTIYYNKDYLNKLTIEQQIFVFAHEVCHIAFNHILRSEGKEIQTWNIATDSVINQLLKKDGLKMVEGIVDIEEAINYNAEEMYEKLLEKNNQEKGPNEKEKQNSNQKPNEKQDNGHDTHSMWDETVKKHNKESKTNNKKNKIENKQEEMQKIGEKEAFKKNREEKKKALEKLKEELSKEVMGYGNTTDSNIRNVTNIGKSKPLIDWRYILKEAINYNVDWSYKNATIEDGVLKANLEEQAIPETEILLDTSNSINETLLKKFLRECKNILKYSKLKVGCFDTKFYGFNEIRNEEDIENMKFIGGGGTNFDIAVNAFSRKAENKIIFTDGEANMPKIPLDVIWIVFSGKKINPKGGKVIQINNKELYNLSDKQLSKKIR